MAKYSFDFKLQVVQDYLSGAGGTVFIANKYHIPAESNVRKWVNAYKKLGASGLRRKRQTKTYSTQFKLNAVNLYLTSEKSYQETANELGMNTPSQIARWVLDYREKGELAFSKARGRPRQEDEVADNKRFKSLTANLSESEQELAKLQTENLNLRMENEYLKGLRRLRMEQQAKENPNLFKTSTDSSSSQSSNF